MAIWMSGLALSSSRLYVSNRTPRTSNRTPQTAHLKPLTSNRTVTLFSVHRTSLFQIKGKQKLYTWNDKICLFRTPKTHHLGVNYWRLFSLVATDVLPIIAMIISTGLIITVIVRIHYKIQVQVGTVIFLFTIFLDHD